MKLQTYLAFIHNATVGVYELQLAICVHVGSLRRREEAESLLASQQDVQIVVEVMMQTAAGTCNDMPSPTSWTYSA